MSKTWYPMISYSACTQCGTCVNNCPHGVYDTSKAPAPLVINPNACIDHCHGCGNRCPAGAITYSGDETGWMPPKGTYEPDSCCCETQEKTQQCCKGSCSCEQHSEDIQLKSKTLVVDFLYLDLKTCERCLKTHDVLLDAVNEVGGILESVGYEIIINKIEIENEEMAIRHKFLSSPTIRINRQDICLEVKENPCGSCSDLGCYPVDCRVFIYEQKEYEVPPKAMIINAILEYVYGNKKAQTVNEQYSLPENLKLFFKGKKSKSCGCC